jgi:exocyst complex component 4
MSGRSPYANGYGYPSDSGRSENGGYGSSSSLGVNGYGGGGGGNRERDRERRPGGYGGFMSEESQRPPTASSTQSRERDYDRGRGGQDRRPSAASSSRSRPRDVNTGTRWRPGRDEGDYMRPMPTNRPEATAGGGRGAQSIEGRYGAPIIMTFLLTFIRGATNDPTKLGLYGHG